MLKFFHLTAALWASSILFISDTAFSRSPTVNGKYPVVESSNTDQLICYMHTADGRTVNLNRLCKNKSNFQILISNVSYEDDRVIGRVINQSSTTIYQARVHYEVMGENDNVIDRGVIAINPSTLSPGQVASFQTGVLGGRNVRVTFAEAQEK